MRVLRILSLAILAAPSLRAQAPVGATTLSAAAVAESLSMIDKLTAYADKHPRDAATFHRIGMIAFALEQRAISPNPPSGLRKWHLWNVAESSLLKALDLEPENPEHWYALGRFTTMGGSGRTVPRAYFEGAVKLARSSADSSELFRAARDLGLANWRHSESKDDKFAQSTYMNSMSDTGALAVASAMPTPRGAEGAAQLNQHKLDRAPKPGLDNSPMFGALTSNAPSSVLGAAGPGNPFLTMPQLMQAAIDTILRTLHNYPTPEAFYLRGEAFTREAYDMRPEDRLVFRQLSAVYLTRARWADIRALADEHIRRDRSDPWGWMTLGLAEQRLKAYRSAGAAFDSGLTRFTPAERARYERFDRILSARDSVRYARLDAAGRAEMARTWWLLADPLWSEDEESPKVEFLARITYADLRWSYDFAVMDGAETADGNIHVRYGPPDEWHGQFSLYRSGIVFSECMRNGRQFRGLCAHAEVELRDRVREWQPSRWDNIANVRIDSMPTQVARFRASGDSVEVYLAARAPIAELRQVQTANASIRANVWLSTWGTQEVREQSVELDGTGLIAVRQVIPTGRYYYRMESFVPGALVAGRTVASMTMGTDTTTGFTMHGFGVSDLLLATSASSPAVPHRWSDFAVVPSMGAVAKGAGVSLVWENYELGDRNGGADYSLTITLDRVRSSVGKITARVVSGFAGAVGMNSSLDRLTMKFDRRVPHAPVVVDNIALAFDTTPAGTYRLTLTVKDLVSGRVSSRVVHLTIDE